MRFLFVAYEGRPPVSPTLRRGGARDGRRQVCRRARGDAPPPAVKAKAKVKVKVKGMTMESSSQVRGCLLGGAVGDALGAPVEFMALSHIRQLYGPDGVTGYTEMDDCGYITDDTQMTLFTAEGLLLARAKATDPVEEVYYAYERWLRTQGIYAPKTVPHERLEEGLLIHEGKLQEQRAPGSTCIRSLCLRRDVILDATHPINDSKGCGTVMRMSPVGLLYPPDQAFRLGSALSALTHGHPSGILAGAATAMMVACIREGASVRESAERALARLASEPRHEEVTEALTQAVRLSEDAAVPVGQALDLLGSGWVAEEALAIAAYCAMRFPHDFRAAVLAAVNISGDSDSTGAITGNLLGASLGVDAIPREWLDALYERDIVEDICEQLLGRRGE